MRSHFGKRALIDNADFVGIDDRREAVGDHNDGFVFEQHVECLFDFIFVFGVGKCGRFIKHDDGGVLQEGAGNGKPLRFSAGKRNRVPRTERRQMQRIKSRFDPLLPLSARKNIRLRRFPQKAGNSHPASPYMRASDALSV